jgi:hypothetical protein
MLFYVYSNKNYEESYTNYTLEKPFEQCQLVKGYYVDTRKTDCPSKVPAYNGKTDWWYKSGVNHRIVDGKICKDFEEEFYVIDINTIDDLLDLQKKARTSIGVEHESNYTFNGKILPELHHDYTME